MKKYLLALLLCLLPAAASAQNANWYVPLWLQSSHTFGAAIQKSKTVEDNVSTPIVRIAVADDDYEACMIHYTAFAEDADTDNRQVRTSSLYIALINNSGTEAIHLAAINTAYLLTTGTLDVSFPSASVVEGTIDLSVQVNTSLDAAAETITFEYKLDCMTVTTLTPL